MFRLSPFPLLCFLIVFGPPLVGAVPLARPAAAVDRPLLSLHDLIESAPPGSTQLDQIVTIFPYGTVTCRSVWHGTGRLSVCQRGCLDERPAEACERPHAVSSQE